MDRPVNWGWTPECEQRWAAALERVPRGARVVPARVVAQEGPRLLVGTAGEVCSAVVSGRWSYLSDGSDLPLVGDWVAVDDQDPQLSVIHAVVERRTVLLRSVADQPVALAANLDTLGIVTGLDLNFNVRRAQRLATLARRGGIEPLWILSKADLAGVEDRVEVARRAAGEDPVVVVSALEGRGLEALEPWLQPGRTLALVGSSGVGKTTLVNALRGSELAVGAVREVDGKGRHTTTSRHLFPLAGGGLLMDTPGVRTVGLWADEDDVAEAFPEIEALAQQCRFPDCHHGNEPGCAVRAARESGALEPLRWEGWLKQSRDLAHQARKENPALAREERDRWKAIHRSMRGFSKETRSRRG